MMTPAPPIDLSDDDLDRINSMLQEATIQAIRAGTISEEQSETIALVDELIVGSAVLTDNVVIYKKVGGRPELAKGGELTDPAYLYGSTEPLIQDEHSKDVVLAIMLEAGDQALEVPGGYITHRGTKLELDPEEDGVIVAVLAG